MVKHILAQFFFFLFAFYSGTLSLLSSHSISFPNAISLVNLSITFLTENKRISLSSTMTRKTLHQNPLSNLTFSHTALFWASRKPHQIAYFSEGEISLFLSQPKMTSIVSGLPAEHLILHNQALLSALGSFLSKQNTHSFVPPLYVLKALHDCRHHVVSQRLVYMVEFFSRPKGPEKLILIWKKKKVQSTVLLPSNWISGFMPICWGSKWT